MADLVVNKDKYLTKGNSAADGSGSSDSDQGAARSRLLVKYLREKGGEKYEEKEDTKRETRKGKRNPPQPQPQPVVDDRQFIEKPIELEDGSKSLILNVTFFIGVTFHITYWRKD